MALELNKALKEAKVLKKDLAAELWPDSNERTQQINISRLCNGKSTSIKIDWVPVICQVCKCTADELFGITNL